MNDDIHSIITENFNVYLVEELRGKRRYYIIPGRRDEMVVAINEVWREAYRKGIHLGLKEKNGELIIEVSEKTGRERIEINIILAVATFFTTAFMGALLAGVNPLESIHNFAKGLPFSISLMTVLGSHELGHYVMAKKRGMKTSLPYFIPFPSLIGTLGAVIKHKGPIPDRKALFDVGAAGPLTGIVIAIIISAIGLSLPSPPPVSKGETLLIGLPPLFIGISILVRGSIPQIMHPVAFAGWIGLFVTLLNLIPVGQLDGGHVLRAMIGERAEKISRIFPLFLILIGIASGYLTGYSSSIWIFWGIFTMFFSMQPHPPPLDDRSDVGRKRILAGIILFILGMLCFTPVPIAYGASP